jgi:hypothetical protein
MKTSGALCLLTAVILLAAQPAFCGEWHTAGSLRCEDCHVQHASERGQPLPGGPFTYLLRKTTINELCLSCHDGTDATAPDVLSPVQMYASTPSGESGAGYFDPAGATNANGHDLGLLATVPLQGAPHTMQLTCASCHAVHGNGNFRNLLTDPAGDGSDIEVVKDTNVFTEFSPDQPPTTAGSVAAYNSSNIAYVSNYSRWCAACHDLLSTNSASTPPAHFNGHPSDVSLNEFLVSRHTDPAHWVAGIGEGFQGAQPGGILRVPYQSLQAKDLVSARTPRESDQVFCLSCHKAHGSPYSKALLWPYVEGQEAYIAGCEQCHNK